jgi:hypothetical protein
VTVESSAASELLHKARWWVDPVEFHERMRSDPAWVAAVRFACEHGIPISVFFGRVVEPGEPLWLPDDTEVAIGFEQWVAAVCPNCGLHRLDWEHEHDETFKGRIETCFGCVELADTRRSIPEKTADDRKMALRVYLVPRSQPERDLLEAHERGEIDGTELTEALTGLT